MHSHSYVAASDTPVASDDETSFMYGNVSSVQNDDEVAAATKEVSIEVDKRDARTIMNEENSYSGK